MSNPDDPHFAGETPLTPPAVAGAGWKWLLLAIGGATAVILFQALDGRELLVRGLDWIAALGPWAPLLFVVVYILSTVLFVPGSVLSLGAGAIFGVAWGALWVSLGATGGAALAFLIGRYGARGWVARKIEGNEKLAALDHAVAVEGWKVVVLTRLSPVFPFTLLNYFFGLTRVRFRDFVLASWLGMTPGTVLYVYVGSLARVGAGPGSPAEWTLYSLGLVATIATVVLITRGARRALAQRTAMSR